MAVRYGLGRFGDRRLEKGGPIACRAGGAAGLVYPSSWPWARGRNAVHTLAAQWFGNGCGDVAACRGLTGQRAAGRHVVAMQDTSELVLGSRRARASYGPVGKGNAAGLLLHPVLAVEVGTGALLGLVWMQAWNRSGGELSPRRKRATAVKESRRWIDGTKQTGEVLAEAASITIGRHRVAAGYCQSPTSRVEAASGTHRVQRR